MVSQIKAALPDAFEPLALRAWTAARPLVRAAFSGKARYCCVCESWTRGFLAHGPASRRRTDVVCPVCLAHDRHRLAWTFFAERTDLLEPERTRLLHFAPEPAFTRRLASAPSIDYLSADLGSPYAMAVMDITAIPEPGGRFDAIYCSHVLEHVADDSAAMREMYRVLRPGGWALVQVPTSGDVTQEDPSVTDPAERERRYWQHDHVRLYGMDIAARLRSAGFAVAIITGRDVLGERDAETFGIDPSEPLFFCEKPGA